MLLTGRLAPAAPVILNEMATQHDAAFIREYLCLTSEGLHRFTKLRPLDQLRQILRHDNEPDLRHFFMHFEGADACAMCL